MAALTWQRLSPPFRRAEAVDVYQAKAGPLVIEVYTVEGGAEVWRYDAYHRSPIVGEPTSRWKIAAGPWVTRAEAQTKADADVRAVQIAINAALGSAPPK